MKKIMNQRTINDKFEKDQFPGKPKILFIGHPNSSHTHNWIDLLACSDFNIRLFPSTNEIPLNTWNIWTYITAFPILGEGYTKTNWIRFPLLFMLQGITKIFFTEILNLFRGKFTDNPNRLGQLDPNPNNEKLLAKPGLDSGRIRQAFHSWRVFWTQAWLAQIINNWQPDIIHALGCFDAQGGEIFFEAIKKFDVIPKGRIVITIRGGSDITLRRYDPQQVEKIKTIFEIADQIISDNRTNFTYLKAMGIIQNKFSSISPIPGSGGIDIDYFQSISTNPPSLRERLILFPKAYECMWSKALPVFEGILLAWDKIQPCKIIMTAMDEESMSWFRTFPEKIRMNCTLFGRIPKQELLKIMGQARIVLFPSLVDGVPNVLYESMAVGAFPIVSPLETISSVVKSEDNVLFARNLYPEEISTALIRAMKDDYLVDEAAKSNLILVQKIADRKKIQEKVVTFYQELVEG